MRGADSNPFGVDGVKHLDFIAIKIVEIIIIIIITSFTYKSGNLVAQLV
jgi:hypothetical protein